MDSSRIQPGAEDESIVEIAIDILTVAGGLITNTLETLTTLVAHTKDHQEKLRRSANAFRWN